MFREAFTEDGVHFGIKALLMLYEYDRRWKSHLLQTNKDHLIIRQLLEGREFIKHTENETIAVLIFSL